MISPSTFFLAVQYTCNNKTWSSIDFIQPSEFEVENYSVLYQQNSNLKYNSYSNSQEIIC